MCIGNILFKLLLYHTHTHTHLIFATQKSQVCSVNDGFKVCIYYFYDKPRVAKELHLTLKQSSAIISVNIDCVRPAAKSLPISVAWWVGGMLVMLTMVKIYNNNCSCSFKE